MSWPPAAVRPLIRLAGLGILALAFMTGCGNQCGGLGGGIGSNLGCGGGTPIPPQSSFAIEGTPGTPFSGIVSDTQASYTFSGVVPLVVVYVNNTPPVQMVLVNKATQPGNILSVEALSGINVAQLQTTSYPGGSVTTTIPTAAGETLGAYSPAATCDVRFYVSAPAGDYYQSLIETQSAAYENATISPTIYFFGNPHGSVDGVFVKTTNYTLMPLTVDLVIDGKLAETQVGTSITLKSGCP